MDYIDLVFRAPEPEFAAKTGCGGLLITTVMLTKWQIEYLRSLKLDERLSDGDVVVIPAREGE
jgi:hypothetical protein